MAYRKVDYRELAGTSNRLAHFLQSRGVGVGDHVGVYAKNSVEHVVALYDASTCGPAPFMTLMNGALRELGFPRERRHQERFVSLCSACACRVLEGEVKMLRNEVLDEEDLADGIRLACQWLPITDTVKVTHH